MGAWRRWLPVLTVGVAVVVAAACSFDEGYFNRRIQELDEVAATASPAAKTKIAALKTELQAAFKKLPAGDARKDALHALGKKANAAVEKARGILTQEVQARKKVEGAALATYRDKFVGHWKSDTVSLSIETGGRVKYERKKKGGMTRNLTANITEFKKSYFKVGFMGIYTVFVINKAPYTDGGKKKMMIDGVTLTRVGGPILGTEVCAEVKDRNCVAPTDTFTPESKVIHVVYRSKKVPKAGQPWSVTWIAADVGKVAPPNHKIGESKGAVKDEGLSKAGYFTVSGNFTRGKKLWPPGTYRVEIRIGGELVSKAVFKVALAPPAPAAPKAGGKAAAE